MNLLERRSCMVDLKDFETDLERVILSEGSQTEKEKYQVTSLICGI